MFVSPNISHPFNKSTSTLYSIKLIILLIIIKWKILLIIIKWKRKYVFFGKEKTKQAKNPTNKWSNCCGLTAVFAVGYILLMLLQTLRSVSQLTFFILKTVEPVYIYIWRKLTNISTDLLQLIKLWWIEITCIL